MVGGRGLAGDGPAHRRADTRCAHGGRRTASAILAIGSGDYGVLYAVAGVCAIVRAVAIVPVKGVRCEPTPSSGVAVALDRVSVFAGTGAPADGSMAAQQHP